MERLLKIRGAVEVLKLLIVDCRGTAFGDRECGAVGQDQRAGGVDLVAEGADGVCDRGGFLQIQCCIDSRFFVRCLGHAFLQVLKSPHGRAV